MVGKDVSDTGVPLDMVDKKVDSVGVVVVVVTAEAETTVDMVVGAAVPAVVADTVLESIVGVDAVDVLLPGVAARIVVEVLLLLLWGTALVVSRFASTVPMILDLT